MFRVSLLYNICCIKSRGETREKQRGRSGCAAFILFRAGSRWSRRGRRRGTRAHSRRQCGRRSRSC
nr:MAG TPA: hypothetical protein [Caudoviricetes sp.]